MLKILFRKPEVYEWFYQRPTLFRFAGYELKYLPQVKSQRTFARIVRRIRLANGSYKTTQEKRFDDIDQYILELLGKKQEYRIHDVAASDGITSVEFIDRLIAKGISFDFLLSDKYSRIFYSERFGCVNYTDADGVTLRSSVGRIMADAGQPWQFGLTKVLGKLLSGMDLFAGVEKKEILLLNPATLDRMQREKVSFVHFDIFDDTQPVERKFDVIRCMNILNPSYFSDPDLIKALRNILRTLTNHGLFIVGRTNTKTNLNYATVYRLENGNLIPLKMFNSGAEVDYLIKQAFTVVEA